MVQFVSYRGTILRDRKKSPSPGKYVIDSGSPHYMSNFLCLICIACSQKGYISVIRLWALITMKHLKVRHHRRNEKKEYNLISSVLQ